MSKEQTKTVIFNDGEEPRKVSFAVPDPVVMGVKVNPKIERRTVQTRVSRAEMYQEELAKTEEVMNRIGDVIKQRNIEAVSDAIEYLPRLQNLCAEYSRLLDGAGVEHRGYMDDSIIIDLCSRLSDVKCCLEDEKS